MTNLITLYHGTNASNTNDVMDSPRATNAINGNGFYLTRDINVARSYGSTVIAYEVEVQVEEFSITRPIDTRHTDPSLDISYSECAKGGIEAFIPAHNITKFIMSIDDSYEV